MDDGSLSVVVRPISCDANNTDASLLSSGAGADGDFIVCVADVPKRQCRIYSIVLALGETTLTFEQILVESITLPFHLCKYAENPNHEILLATKI